MSLVAVASNPFQRYDGIRKPEGKKEPKIEPDPKLEQLLEKFEQTMEAWRGTKLRSPGSLLIPEVLTPEQIARFLQCTIKFEEAQSYRDHVGMYISTLIQNSYNFARHNSFRLNTKSITKPINILCYGVKGTAERPLEVSIDGSIGSYCGEEAENVKFTIDGNARNDFGRLAKHANFTIRGNAGFCCGLKAEHSEFTIYGDAEHSCGDKSKNCKFDIHGIMDPNMYPLFANGTTFVVRSKRDYLGLCDSLRLGGKNNTVKLVDSTGATLRERVVP